MKTILVGWYLVKSALPSEGLYVLHDPKKNIELAIRHEKEYTEKTWVKIQSIANCDKSWSESDLRWETFCIAETFEEVECKLHDIFPINGIIFC